MTLSSWCKEKFYFGQSWKVKGFYNVETLKLKSYLLTFDIILAKIHDDGIPFRYSFFLEELILSLWFGVFP